MAQKYLSMPMVSTPTKESSFPVLEKQFNVEDVQESYIKQKDSLVTAIDQTKEILGDLRTFNKEEWVVRYPHLQEAQEPSTPPSSSRRSNMRRSMSFADDPATQHEVVVQPARKGLTRALTLASIADAQEEEVEQTSANEEDERLLPPSSDFQILKLDLKLGTHGSSTSPTSLVSQLEKNSIANLLDERIGASMAHVEKLRLRVEDTSSKVLVTGDLNAGKSTFVNALLRREVMPVDQQPCTTAFCEVRDAAENDGQEEVHILKEGVVYSIKDETTFSRGTIANLEEIIAENENSEAMLKLYLADTRAPAESLLNNGVVDISLIDAPGLNRDSIKTTALFARQEEIDVVVFVVSAENHFTLSAKEFLWQASNEKAYLFIVVNKYEQIKNKEKCKRMVLEQIKQLSPRTYEDAEDLVHFVDSASALQPYAANPAFDDLESSLRSFVLVKRSKSKLHPVSTYLSNLLLDIDLLSGANAIVANSELTHAKEDLDRVRPILEKMKSGREALEDGLEAVEEEGASEATKRTKVVLTGALDRVEQGKPGIETPLVNMPSYPGLLGLWEYTQDVRKALLTSLDLAVKMAEDEARNTTVTGVKRISHLGDVHLPEGVERSKRVFMPEAMFALSRGRKAGNLKKRGSMSGAVVAGGLHGLGIGLAQRPDLLETTFSDVFDAHHQLWVHFGGDSKLDSHDEEESAFSALSLVSVGVGALTMVGGQALGMRGVIEGIVRISDLIADENTRKWAAPAIGAGILGLTAYYIVELPSSIPRTVGRRIRSGLAKESREGDAWVDLHATRVSRETRKVLRLASWDLREKFRSAMEQRGKEVKGAEEMEKKARRAMEYFEGVETKTRDVRVEAGLVGAF